MWNHNAGLDGPPPQLSNHTCFGWDDRTHKAAPPGVKPEHWGSCFAHPEKDYSFPKEYLDADGKYAGIEVASIPPISYMFLMGVLHGTHRGRLMKNTETVAECHA